MESLNFRQELLLLGVDYPNPYYTVLAIFEEEITLDELAEAVRVNYYDEYKEDKLAEFFHASKVKAETLMEGGQAQALGRTLRLRWVPDDKNVHIGSTRSLQLIADYGGEDEGIVGDEDAIGDGDATTNK